MYAFLKYVICHEPNNQLQGESQNYKLKKKILIIETSTSMDLKAFMRERTTKIIMFNNYAVCFVESYIM